MKQAAIMAAFAAGSIAAAGCVPVPPPLPMATQLDHIVMVLDFACADGAEVSASITGTRIELSTSSFSKVYTGAYPTYFGHEASVSFAGTYGSFVRTEPGVRQTCVLTGTD
jgi:hypothetical protein